MERQSEEKTIGAVAVVEAVAVMTVLTEREAVVVVAGTVLRDVDLSLR